MNPHDELRAAAAAIRGSTPRRRVGASPRVSSSRDTILAANQRACALHRWRERWNDDATESLRRCHCLLGAVSARCASRPRVPSKVSDLGGISSPPARQLQPPSSEPTPAFELPTLPPRPFERHASVLQGPRLRRALGLRVWRRFVAHGPAAFCRKNVDGSERARVGTRAWPSTSHLAQRPHSQQPC